MKSEIDAETLLVEYKHNPRKGFELIYAAMADRLVQYAIHSFRLRAEEAEDAVQEVFLPWVQNPRKMSGVENLKAYLYTSLRNACKKRASAAHDSELQEYVAAEPSFDLYVRTDIEKALQKLPYEQRESVFLKIWGDLSFAEIAAIQDTGLQTTASRYRIALAKLKEILKWNQ